MQRVHARQEEYNKRSDHHEVQNGRGINEYYADHGREIRPPGVVFVDVVFRSRWGVPIHSPIFWVGKRLSFTIPAEVHLTPAGGVVASGTTDEAAYVRAES